MAEEEKYRAATKSITEDSLRAGRQRAAMMLLNAERTVERPAREGVHSLSQHTVEVMIG